MKKILPNKIISSLLHFLYVDTALSSLRHYSPYIYVLGKSSLNGDTAAVEALAFPITCFDLQEERLIHEPSRRSRNDVVSACTRNGSFHESFGKPRNDDTLALTTVTTLPPGLCDLNGHRIISVTVMGMLCFDLLKKRFD